MTAYHSKWYVSHWSDCKQCPWKDICVSIGSQNAARGRMLNRNIYEDHMDLNDEVVKAIKNEYRRRQAIVEHPFGTIKRQWGFTHTSLKGLNKVNGEFGLILLCYNIKRVITILGVKGLKEALKTLKSTFFNISAYRQNHNRKIYFTLDTFPQHSLIFSYF